MTPVSAAKDQDSGETCMSTSGMMGICLLCLCCSVAKPVSNSLQPHGLQHTRLPCPSHLWEFAQTHVHCVGDAIQPSHPVTPFSSCPQSFPASGSFPVSQPFASSVQNIGASALASLLPMKIPTKLVSSLSSPEEISVCTKTFHLLEMI